MVTDEDKDAAGKEQPKPKFASPKPVKKKELIELHAGTAAFEGAKKALQAGTHTMEQIKGKYKMEIEVEKLLTAK